MSTTISEPTRASVEPVFRDREVTILDVLTQLALRKVLIARVVAVALALGLVLSFALPVRYTATAKIMPPQQTQSSSTLLMGQMVASSPGALAAIASGGLALKNPNDLYVALLTSRPIADAVIQHFDLVKLYGSRDMTVARKRLAKRSAVLSEKNGLIAISVTDRDKARAAAMANAYTDELRSLTKKIALTEASQRRFFYEDQLRQSKDALVNAQQQFQTVQMQKGLVQLDSQAKVMIESLAAVRARASAKQVEVQALRSYSTERNPDLALAERELEALQGEIARLQQSNHSSNSANLALQDVPSAGLEYLRADHELRYQQALYDMLLRQYDAARLDEAKDAVVIQVVESAIPPDRRSSPQRLLILLGSLIIGIFVGCTLALLDRWLDVMRSDPESALMLRDLRAAINARSRA
ncbi:MAG: chain length determinant family protein [Acidobacteria bacterium]|nr:chain length determinant family protein [Acidobacteriota bacterium]